MKKKRISIYIILLISLLFSTAARAQENKPLTDEQYKATPLFQGLFVGVDIWGLGEKVFGSDYTSASASITANLKNRYFPTAEIGYGKIDITNDNNIHFATSAPFFKIGADYNFFYRKTYLPGYLYGGLRIAYSSFSYDLSAPSMTDPTWGNITVPFSFNGVKGSSTWAELVIGIKTKIYKSFSMGWSVRYRVMINNKKSENSEPLYIPGYGMSNSSKFGVTYNLIYNLPFKR